MPGRHRPWKDGKRRGAGSGARLAFPCPRRARPAGRAGMGTRRLPEASSTLPEVLETMRPDRYGCLEPREYLPPNYFRLGSPDLVNDQCNKRRWPPETEELIVCMYHAPLGEGRCSVPGTRDISSRWPRRMFQLTRAAFPGISICQLSPCRSVRWWWPRIPDD